MNMVSWLVCCSDGLLVLLASAVLWLLCLLRLLGRGPSRLLRSQVCLGQLVWSSQGLIVLAGVDEAALLAFFKPSLGAALLSLLPTVGFQVVPLPFGGIRIK